MRKSLSMMIVAAMTTIGWSPIAHSTTPVEKFRVMGTEPFWELEVSKQGSIYTNPEGRKKISAYVRPLTAQNRDTDSLRVYRFPGGNTLVLRKESCSYSEGEIHPYSAVLIIDRQVLDGCARAE